MPVSGHFRDYDALPEAIRCQVSRTEWAWLPDEEKARLQRNMTEPEDDAEEPAA